MDIVEISEQLGNLHLLQDFIKNNLSSHFRYFDKRDLTCIKNHLCTAVGLVKGKPVGYGHLDREERVWLGVCILEQYQGHHYGLQMTQYLLDKSIKLGVSKVWLAVDADNTKAVNLYRKLMFVVEYCTPKIIFMSREAERAIRDTIFLPVSYGEAFDKLSILDIKMDKISDQARRADVEREFTAIHSKLTQLMDNRSIAFHYKILKQVNLAIWDMQDKFRDEHDTIHKNVLCTLIIVENDRRFRIKAKINNLTNSHFKEQKGYKPRQVYLVPDKNISLSLETNLKLCGLVRYYSTLYERVIVVCETEQVSRLAEIYRDDPVIQVVTKQQGLALINEHDIDRDIPIDCITLGNPIASSAESDPKLFYTDLNLDPAIMTDYSHFP